jgi:hypothetical protein
MQPGDIIIRSAGGVFYLHDAQTQRLLLTSQTLRGALDLAMAHGRTVWRENTDLRGRPVGEPVMLIPASHVEGSRMAPQLARRSRLGPKRVVGA